MSDTATHPDPEASVTPTDSLTAEMDRISLDQALRDFEIANARVLDLTRRVTSLSAEVTRLSDENARLRVLAARLAELEGSKAYVAVQAYRRGSATAGPALRKLLRRR